jgi:hypothetical protein
MSMRSGEIRPSVSVSPLDERIEADIIAVLRSADGPLTGDEIRLHVVGSNARITWALRRLTDSGRLAHPGRDGYRLAAAGRAYPGQAGRAAR